MNKTRAMHAAALALAMAGLLSCKSNHPPDVPVVPTGPAYCFKDTIYTFKTIVNDPEGDRVAAHFDCGDSTTTYWVGWFASGDTIMYTHAWRDTGTFEVSVQATDEGQHRSGWSSAFALRVVLRRPPNMPHELAGPDKGGQDSSYTFATSASHPDSITVAIRFAWGDGDTSDWGAFAAPGESMAMSHVWTAPDTYVVTAQARDTGSGLSLWSLPHSIIIKPPDTLRKWRFQLQDSAVPSYSSPAIGPDGTIYVGSPDSSLYAVNSDGTLKWRYQTGGSVQSSPAIAPTGTVYVGSEDHYLYAFDPAGTLKWRHLADSYVRSSPAITADGAIWFGSGNDVYGLNSEGALKWRYTTGGLVSSSPCIATDRTIYVGSYDDFLYALYPDGTLKWRYDVGANINRASVAIGSDGTVYCGADEDHSPTQNFYALRPDGTLKWSCTTGTAIRSSPAIAPDGTIYVGSWDAYFYALNPDSTLRWRYQFNGHTRYSSPAVGSDGTVYVGSADDLSALNPDGTLKWQYDTDGNVYSSPTIDSDGTVYFVSNDGYLYALKGTSPLAESPWPKFHHDLRNTGRVGGGK